MTAQITEVHKSLKRALGGVLAIWFAPDFLLGANGVSVSRASPCVSAYA